MWLVIKDIILLQQNKIKQLPISENQKSKTNVKKTVVKISFLKKGK